MEFDKIFEIVRKEDAVLWVGSGFSLYAGYPSGQQLADSIYNNLLPKDQVEMAPNLPLSEVAEQYVRLMGGSKTGLVSILKSELNKAPLLLKWHETIAGIPHIQTIITTNYDHLFEKAYNRNIYPIIFPSDVASRDHRTALYKVHGDIDYPDSIVLTRSDYADFFYHNQKDNLVWTAVKERIASKSIIFMGYDLEDENIKNILRGVYEQLGTNRKELFLLAPKLQPHKIQYLAQLGFQYIDCTAETFIEKLYENIKDRITTDFSKGWVSAETLRSFYRKNNLLVELRAFDDRFKMTSVSPVTENPETTINLSFKKEKDFEDSFQNLVEGSKFGQLTIDKANLTQLKILLNGVNIIDDDAEYRLRIASIPISHGSVNLLFDDGSEFENITYELFRSNEFLEILAKFKQCEYRLKFSAADIQDSTERLSSSFTFNLPKTFANVNDAISAFKLSLNLSKGEGCTSFSREHPKGIYIKPGGSKNLSAPFESNLEFFETLKKVEKIYRIRFDDIGQYTRDDFDNAYNAVMMANGAIHTQEWDEELSWDLDSGVSLELLLTIENGAVFSVEAQSVEEIQIYDQKISLGYQVTEPLDLYIVNMEDVKMRRTSVVKVRSRSKTVRIYYTANRRLENQY